MVTVFLATLLFINVIYSACKWLVFIEWVVLNFHWISGLCFPIHGIIVVFTDQLLVLIVTHFASVAADSLSFPSISPIFMTAMKDVSDPVYVNLLLKTIEHWGL